MYFSVSVSVGGIGNWGWREIFTWVVVISADMVMGGVTGYTDILINISALVHQTPNTQNTHKTHTQNTHTKYTHTHTHTHTKHTHTHTTHTHTHTHTHARMHTRPRTHTRPHTHARTHNIVVQYGLTQSNCMLGEFFIPIFHSWLTSGGPTTTVRPCL